jgi:hypothetical protein
MTLAAGLQEAAHQRGHLVLLAGGPVDPVQETAERRGELAGLPVWRLIGHSLDLQLPRPSPAAVAGGRDTQPSVSGAAPIA